MSLTTTQLTFGVMEGDSEDWTIINNFIDGKGSVRILEVALQRIKVLANTDGIPNPGLMALLKLFSCDRMKKIVKSYEKKHSNINKADEICPIIDDIINCFMPNEILNEQFVILLVGTIISFISDSIMEPYVTLLCQWLLYALHHEYISKEVILCNFYFYFLVFLKSKDYTENVFLLIVHILKTVTKSEVVNSVSSSLVNKIWNQLDRHWRKLLAVLVLEFQAYNALNHISCKEHFIIDIESLLVTGLFIHGIKPEQRPESQVRFTGLPFPEYSGVGSLRLLDISSCLELIHAVSMNRIDIPRNTLSVLATMPGQLFAAIQPAGDEWMTMFMEDAQAALESEKERVAIATALVSLQNVAKYPFPPLTSYFHVLLNTFKGNFKSDDGKFILQCIPYLDITDDIDFHLLLNPVLDGFKNSSLIEKAKVLKALSCLHTNLVTMVIDREEPIPFKGSKPEWTKHPKSTIAALVKEEKNFIEHFLEQHYTPAALLISVSFYERIIKGEEQLCQVWTLPSEMEISMWMSCRHYIVYEAVCDLFWQYYNFLNLAQNLGKIQLFEDKINKMEKLSQQVYRLLLVKNISETWLGRQMKLKSRHFRSESQVSVLLRNNPAFKFILDKIGINEETVVTEEEVLQKIKMFAPKCAEFIEKWQSSNW